MTARSVPRHCQVSPWESGPPPAENTGQERSLQSPPPTKSVPIQHLFLRVGEGEIPLGFLLSTLITTTHFIRKGLAMQAPVSSLHLVLSLLCFESVPRNLYQMAIFVPSISLSQGILLRGCSYTLYFLLPDFPRGFRFPKFEGLPFKGRKQEKDSLRCFTTPW